MLHGAISVRVYISAVNIPLITPSTPPIFSRQRAAIMNRNTEETGAYSRELVGDGATCPRLPVGRGDSRDRITESNLPENPQSMNS